ncbi:MAG: beta-propeller domain-containing protein [Myxococcota bacterium]
MKRSPPPSRLRYRRPLSCWLPCVLTLSALTVVSSCTDEAGETEPDRTPISTAKLALTRMDSCDAVEQYIEDRLIDEVRRQFDAMQNRGGPVPPGVGDDFAGAPGAPETASGGSTNDRDAPTDFTDTNVQEAGVDEADFVKTDGVRTYVLSGQRLYVAQTWPPEALQVEDALEISGSPIEMFLTENDQLVVFSRDWTTSDGPGGPTVEPGLPEPAIDCLGFGCFYGQSFLRVTLIDASGERLAVTSEILLNGDYRSSRRTGEAVRIISAESIQFPPELQFWPGDHAGLNDEDTWEDALDELLAENIDRIRAATLTDFLPSVSVEDSEGVIIPERDCTQFHEPNAPVPLGFATLTTLDLRDGSIQQTSVFGAAEQVYASTETLYLASIHWWFTPEIESPHTYVHAFDLEASGSTYRGSFGVPGTLLNQFSMDEHAGHVRLATHVRTFSNRDIDDVELGSFPSLTNRVTVFRKDDFGFTEVGRTGDLAPNEQIFSARMEGDRGFLVTFERIDPLFTLDLSDPTNPRMVGELKVPGFSTYIHFLDDDHLLTIGEHVPDPSFPDADFPRGLKLSVFDVSDFANPTEKFVAYLGDAFSEATYDHKAFNYFPARSTLAIPAADYRFDGAFSSELRLFEVNAETGIQPLGAIAMGDMFTEPDAWGYSYSPYVRRSVLADDYAYAISDAGIRVAPIDAPTEVVATALFAAP